MLCLRIHNLEITLPNSCKMRWLKLIIIARSRRAALQASSDASIQLNGFMNTFLTLPVCLKEYSLP